MYCCLQNLSFSVLPRDPGGSVVEGRGLQLGWKQSWVQIGLEPILGSKWVTVGLLFLHQFIPHPLHTILLFMSA